MTKPRILDQKRPTDWSHSDLKVWDLERCDAEQEWANWLFAQPVDSLTPADWAFLDTVTPEVPIN